MNLTDFPNVGKFPSILSLFLLHFVQREKTCLKFGVKTLNLQIFFPSKKNLVLNRK